MFRQIVDELEIQELYLKEIKRLGRGLNADERTRTSTRLLPQRPERCASTSSATSALKVGIVLTRIETVKEARFPVAS